MKEIVTLWNRHKKTILAARKSGNLMLLNKLIQPIKKKIGDYVPGNDKERDVLRQLEGRLNILLIDASRVGQDEPQEMIEEKSVGNIAHEKKRTYSDIINRKPPVVEVQEKGELQQKIEELEDSGNPLERLNKLIEALS
jgi:hypothetical protein